MTEHAVPPGSADLPLSVRQRLDAEADRELRDRLVSRHFALAAERQRYLDLIFAHALRVGPALAADIAGIRRRAG